MEKEKLKSIPAKFGNYEAVNDTVSKVKISIMYGGKNRNGSYMSKETIESAIPTLYGAPVIGEYESNKDNFGGHGGKIVIDSNGIEFIETTRPWGFIDASPEYANVRWEEVEDENGNKMNYLVADAYLWRKRYPELDIVFEKGANQSMEIDLNDYEWSDELDAWEIKSFSFSALCILGYSENKDENTEPCFESASVKAYSLDKDTFKAEFSLMMQEIKDSFKVVEEVTLEVVEDAIQEEAFEVVETIEEVIETFEETTESEVVEESVEAETVEPIEEVVVIEEFDYESEYNLLCVKYATLELEFESMKSAFSVYQEKEQLEAQALLDSQKDEVFEKYDELLSENEAYAQIKASKNEYTVDMLETTLAVLYVKSNVQFSAKQSNKSSIVKLGNDDELNNKIKPVADPYGGLFTKTN